MTLKAERTSTAFFSKTHCRPVIASILLVAMSGCSSSVGSGLVSPSGRSLAGVSPFQIELLEDGELSFSEYESAMFSMVACLQDAGIDARGPTLRDNRTYSFSTRDPDADHIEEFQNAFDQCYEDNLSIVEYEWADNIAPSPEEEDRFYEGVAECMRQKGFPVDSTEPAELSRVNSEHSEEYRACLEEVASDS